MRQQIPILMQSIERKTRVTLKNAPAYKIQQSLNKAIYAKLAIMFQTVYAINIQV